MNTITFSELQAWMTCKATSIPAAFHVEIKREGTEWSMYSIAHKNGETWDLYGIRYGGPMDTYPEIHEIIDFMQYLDTRLQDLLDKLIPSHKNESNE